LIEWEKRVLLVHYLEQKLPKSAIAERLRIDRRTTHRWIATGQLDRDVSGMLSPPVRRLSRPPKIEPFLSIVDQRLED
jgi:hypothetical protein